MNSEKRFEQILRSYFDAIEALRDRDGDRAIALVRQAESPENVALVRAIVEQGDEITYVIRPQLVAYALDRISSNRTDTQ